MFARSGLQCDAMEAAGKHSMLPVRIFCFIIKPVNEPLPFLQCPVERGMLPIVLTSNTMLKAEYLNDAG